MGKVINLSKAGVICSLPLQVDCLRKKEGGNSALLYLVGQRVNPWCSRLQWFKKC